MNQKIQRLTRFSEYLLPILAVFTVTFFVYRDFGIRMLYGFGILCLVLGVHVLRRLVCRIPLKLRRTDAALGMLALVILVNFLRPDSSHSSDTAAYILAMIICTAFVWLYRPGQSRSGMAVLLIGGAVMCAFCLVFTFAKGLFFDTIAPHLTDLAAHYLTYFVEKGYGIALGGYTFSDYVLFCGAAVCCGLLTQKQPLRRRLALLAAVGVFVFTILTLGRRGELLAAVFVCGVTWLIFCTPRQRIGLLLGGTALCAAALVLIFAFLPQIKEIDIFYRYVRTIENMVNGYDFTSGRGQLFAWAIQGFRSAPLFGIGFDRYVTLVNPLLTDIEGNVLSDAHNIYLQFLCETGIVGTVLILLPLGYLFVTTCRTMTGAKKSGNTAALLPAVVSFMIQFFLLFVGLYDPSFQKIVFWCFYAIAIMLLKDAMAGKDGGE